MIFDVAFLMTCHFCDVAIAAINDETLLLQQVFSTDINTRDQKCVGKKQK